MRRIVTRVVVSLFFVSIFFSCKNVREPISAVVDEEVAEGLKLDGGESSEIRFSLEHAQVNDEVEIRVSDPSLFVIESVNGEAVDGSSSYVYKVRSVESDVVVKVKGLSDAGSANGKSASVGLFSEEKELVTVSLAVASPMKIVPHKTSVAVSSGETKDIVFDVENVRAGKVAAFNILGINYIDVLSVNGQAFSEGFSYVFKDTDAQIVVRVSGLEIGNAEISVIVDEVYAEKVSVAVCEDMVVAADKYCEEINLGEEKDIFFTLEAVREDAVLTFSIPDADLAQITAVNGVAVSPCNTATYMVKASDESVKVRVKSFKKGSTSVSVNYNGEEAAVTSLELYNYVVKYMIYDGQQWSDIIYTDVESGSDLPEVGVPDDFVIKSASYKFAGWTKEDLSGRKVTEFDGEEYTGKVTENLVLYAMYETERMTLEFMSYNGSSWQQFRTRDNVKSGSGIPDIGAPEKFLLDSEQKVYSFVGWTAENLSGKAPAEFASAAVFSGRITHSTTFYAVYSSMSVHINYKYFNGSKWLDYMTDKVVVSGSDLPQLDMIPGVSGKFTSKDSEGDDVEYVFKGWTTQNITSRTNGKDMEVDVYDGKIAKDITVYAAYKPNEFFVNFKTYNGNRWEEFGVDDNNNKIHRYKSGSVLNEVIKTTDSTKNVSVVGTPEVFRGPDNTAYKPIGWTTAELDKKSNPYDFETDVYDGKVLKEMTVYSAYKPLIASIAYADMNDKPFSGVLADSTPDLHRYGNPTVLKDPSRRGYDFNGWYYGNTRVYDLLDIESMLNYAEHITLCAKWTAQKYNINYNLGEGSISGAYSTQHTYDTDTILPAIDKVNRTGYTFEGWFLDSALTKPVTKLGGQEYIAAMSVYPKWTPITYNVTYEMNGHGSPIAVTQHTYDTATALANPAAVRGYTFGGWFANNSAMTGSAVTSLSKRGYTADIKLYAKWTANVYSISYNLNSGTMPSTYPKTHTYDAATTLPSPTRVGYTFSGWYETSNFSSANLTSLGATDYVGTITLYAKWTPITYQISYNVNGGTMPASYAKTHTYATATTLPTPTLSGYTFGGWYTSSSFGGSSLSSLAATGYTANITLYAKWMSKISYSTAYGSASATYVNKGASMTSANLPTLSASGRVFSGWYSGSTQINTGYVPAGDMTLTAKWTTPVTGVSLSESSYIFQSVSGSKQLTATISPSDATNKSVTWESSDTSVVRVSSSGLVTPVGSGSASVSVKTSDGGKIASMVFIVVDTSSGMSYSSDVRTATGDGLPDSNYKTDSRMQIAYEIKSSGHLDIVGRANSSSSWQKSTYANGGWRWKINDTEVQLNSSGVATYDNLQLLISPTVAYENNTPYIVIYQTLTNIGTSTRSGLKFGAGADVQVGSNDAAPINKTDYGESMTNGSLYFNLYCMSGQAVTPATTVWAGAYSGYFNNVYSNNWASYNGGDSAMCYSWQNITLAPGKSVVKCVRMTLTGS